ncbi:Fe-S cluster assembly ATPase SufC [Candidatus Woesearchaeota archaeon]|nr:Fe-S cluster assembly ATPase SufC [Candidatus Woesearchaeota archaeon]
MNDLEIKNLHVTVEGTEILKGVNLTVSKGEVVALMGPNGSGKSTLAYTIAGHPSYVVTKGKIIFKGKDMTKLSPDKRAKEGLFLSFQYPQEISGVSIANFLRTAVNAKLSSKMPVKEFMKLLKEKMQLLKMDESFVKRYVNEGFSGGEKKRAEILQLAMLKPEMAMLDETDSGLDITSMKTVAEGIKKVMSKDMGVLLITHYQRFLNYIKPDRVIVMINGKIVKEGGHKLVEELEAKGYEELLAET